MVVVWKKQQVFPPPARSNLPAFNIFQSIADVLKLECFLQLNPAITANFEEIVEPCSGFFIFSTTDSLTGFVMTAMWFIITWKTHCDTTE